MAQLDDIQGNLLRGYGLRFAHYVFLRIDDPAQGRAWLGRVINSVTSVSAWDKWDEKEPKWTFNVAFTFAGLRALGLPRETLATFPAAFQEGMANRAAEHLGDAGASSRDNWIFGKDGKDSKPLHALVEIHAESDALCTAQYNWHQEMLGTAVSPVFDQKTAMLPGETEHFGFRDGFGQPDVQDSGVPGHPGQGKPNPAGGWSPIALGEFVLGYYDETGHCEPMPQPEVLGHNGSYLAVRMLRQNVAAFRSFLQLQSAELGVDRDFLAAKMVGRWRSGAPLALAPNQDDKVLGKDPALNNDFRYKDDLKGLICPRTSHIRRTNPRDALDKDPHVIVSRHRILRRGMPYGEVLAEGAPDNGDRGIIFIAVNASIARQFEFVQKIWVNDGDFIDRGTEKDPIIGSQEPDAIFSIPAKPIPKRATGLSSFVVTAGGGYFFLPGIKALQHLRDGIGQGNMGTGKSASPASPAAACPFLSKFDSLGESEKGADLVKARAELLKEGIFHHPAELFAELRAQRPVLVTGVPVLNAVVAASANVTEVLSNNTTFRVTPYQNPINIDAPPAGLGHFLLADLDLGRHDREKEAFKSAMKSGDQCRTEIRKHAEDLVALAQARNDRQIDVIKDVAERLPIRMFAFYFGVPTGDAGGMPEADMYHHIGRIFRGLFMNLVRDPAVQADAVTSMEILRKYVDWLVHARKAQVLDSAQLPEDVLGKFIWFHGRPESPYRDVFSSEERVVANLCGILTGGVVGFSQAIGNIVDVLSTQDPSIWKGAVSAATSNRVNELWGYAQEALRFKPQGPGIVRGTIGATTLAGVTIPEKSIVMASNQSAMMDEKLVPDPLRFDPTRPDSCYLHFGYGRNRCLAVDLAPVVITEALRAILRLKNVRRSAESKLKIGEPYPESFVLSYDS